MLHLAMYCTDQLGGSASEIKVLIDLLGNITVLHISINYCEKPFLH